MWIPFGNNPDTCPVRALRQWVEIACGLEDDENAPVFRRVRKGGAIGTDGLSAKSVSLIIKRAATAAGLDASGFSGHSLRAGFATEAACNGKSERQIAKVTRHKDWKVLAGYIRDAEERSETNTAAGAVGL